MSSITVLGAGKMGSGIAQLLAQEQQEVQLIDPVEKALDQARTFLKEQIHLFYRKGMIQELPSKVESRISYHSYVQEASTSWLVIEAVPERLELKQQVFEELESVCHEKTLFATNTSGLSIQAIATNLQHPERLVGTHFFMPAPLIPLVEVVKGEETAQQQIETVYNFLKDLGKVPVLVKKEVPGFIANRLQHAIMREALSLVERGVASPQAVDQVVRYSLGLRFLFSGPFEQRDINGLDIHNDIASYLYPDLDRSSSSSPILQEKVNRGEIGLRSGKGFYDWTGRERTEVLKKKNEQLISLLQWLEEK